MYSFSICFEFFFSFICLNLFVMSFFNAVDAQHDVKQAIKMQWGFCQTPVCVFE